MLLTHIQLCFHHFFLGWRVENLRAFTGEIHTFKLSHVSLNSVRLEQIIAGYRLFHSFTPGEGQLLALHVSTLMSNLDAGDA